MKISDRTKELRDVLANCTINTDGRTALEYKINQMEAAVIEDLQAARQDGYKVGYTEGLRVCNIGRISLTADKMS